MDQIKMLLLSIICLLTGTHSWASSTNDQENVRNFSTFHEGMIKTIHADGWLHTFLTRQADGLTGHPEALSYPYNTCLWAGEISRNTEVYGANWWRYEQTAYYTDGLLKLGYLLNNDAFINKAKEGIEYTLSHVSSTGVLGNSTLAGITWPMSVYFRVLQTEYEHDADAQIPAALEKHFLNFSKQDISGGIVGGRNIVSIEGMLWTYAHTGDSALLKCAEDAYNLGDFSLNAATINSQEPYYMHSVTFCEMLKLPILLYAYTGNEKYLQLAMAAVRKVEKEDMLPDGVPTSAEYLYNHDIDVSHETCNIVDYTWTLGYFLMVTGNAEWADKMELAVYNAGLGSITKDFKSLQYFSSLNQFIATGTSDHNIYKHGSTWMAYRPTHETECCSGNVNRMMPNFVGRMWMTDKVGGAVAALYGPSEVTFPASDSTGLTISEATNYPFDGTINFSVSSTDHSSSSATLPLTLRIPAWCTSATLSVNGISSNQTLVSGTYFKLPDALKSGDVITLTLDMPVVKKEVPHQGVYFQRGPLLLSYAIPDRQVEDTVTYANMNGKKSENPDFKCWDITPVGDFNYAYSSDGNPFAVQSTNKTGYPFDLDSVPYTVSIPVKQTDWQLTEGRYTPSLPAPGTAKLLSDHVSYIQLVPYGSTLLRLTVFPDADAAKEATTEKDYTEPADKQDCVTAIQGKLYAYFEQPASWENTPMTNVWNQTTYFTTSKDSTLMGDALKNVGTTAKGRTIWLWEGPVVNTASYPSRIQFNNGDLRTGSMPFVNGSYYSYYERQYTLGVTSSISQSSVVASGDKNTYYTLSGVPLKQLPNQPGAYIRNHQVVIIR